MRKKAFIAALAAALALPVFSFSMTNAALADYYVPVQVKKEDFKDVPKNHPYYEIIKEMQEQGIINGYPDGYFMPKRVIGREHAAALIVRAAKVNGIEIKKVREFVQPKDLDSSHEYYNEIKTLMEAGLLETDEKGNINPLKALTRGEMAKILTVVFGLKVKADYLFEDVKGTGYEEYVKALYSNGVTTGYEDHTFRVDASLTREHYALFVYRAMHPDENYVPAPIPQPTTTQKEMPKIKYSNLSFSERNKIPKPAGYVPGEHEKKNEETMKQIMAENAHGFKAGFIIFEEFHDDDDAFITSLEEQVRYDAEHILGISYEEFVNIINYCIDTGKVYNGKSFAVYFDYQKNHVVFSGVRNHTNL